MNNDEVIQANKWFSSFLESIINYKKKLTKEDKENIEKYFSLFADISFSNLDKYDDAKEVIRKLHNIVLYYGLDGRCEDTQFFKDYMQKGFPGLYPEECANKILQECEEGNFENVGKLEDIASLITSSDLNHEFMKKILEMLEKNGVDRNHNKVVDAQLKRWLFFKQYDPYETFDDIEKRSIEYISEYLKNIISAPDFNIFNEQWLCNFIQLKVNGQVSNEFSSMIAGFMDEDKDITENKIAISIFMNEYKNKAEIDEHKFDEFIRHLGTIKLHTGVMPRDAVNFLMKQILDKDSLISQKADKYIGIVERTIEDFASWDLAGRVKLKHNYSYFIKDEVDGATIVLGCCDQSNHIIELNRASIHKVVKDKDISILATIFHENAHAEQAYDRAEGKCDNFVRYMIAKERILKNEYEGYYEKNYKFTYEELDARLEEARMLQKFISKLNINIEDLSYTASNLVTYKGKDINDKLEQDIEYNTLMSIKGENKSQTLGETDSKNIYEMIDEVIARKPELLQENPILKMEYNEDGTKKSLEELLAMVIMSKNIVHSNMILHFFRNANVFKRENIIQDMKTLASFDCEGNKSAENTITLITSDVFENMFKRIKLETSSMDRTQLENLKQEMHTIQSIIISDTNSRAFKVGMSHSIKKSAEKKSPVKHFMDIKEQIESQFKQLENINEDSTTKWMKRFNYWNESSSKELADIAERKECIQVIANAVKENKLKETEK